MLYLFFFFKQKTAYDMRISDWSSDVCSSDLRGAHQAGELAEVHLGHEDPRVAGQDRSEVGRERVQVGQVGGGDPPAASPGPSRGTVDRAPGGAPAEHQHPCLVDVAPDLHRGDVVCDAGDLLGPETGHALVVVGGVTDVSGAVLPLHAHATVSQT